MELEERSSAKKQVPTGPAPTDTTRTDPASRARGRSMPFGAEVQPDGGVRFALWAPGAESLSLALEGKEELLPMMRGEDGFYSLTTNEAQVGSRYRFVLPDGMRVPDPASRYQPEDVHGPSEVIDPGQYAWQETGWRGRPWHEAVLYELHVGAFTEEGTFRSAIERLPHLVELGVTAIEIMPVADFPGRWDWGYNGVLLYAPDSSYGRPEDLKALIDAAHAHGIMVLLDVVYNHFGPEGNYIGLYAPNLVTDRHHTPWGSALNYDGPESKAVREFMIENAMYWVSEFRLDGLRLDAVHEIKDDSPTHLLSEIAERVRALDPDFPRHLVLENEANEAHRLRHVDGSCVQYTAQWNDDIHHVLHTAATLEAQGYYGDYEGDYNKLGRAIAEGFAFQGEVMQASGKPRGENSAELPPTSFVAFMQNHDQIGNRAFGERITDIASPEAARAIATVYLLLPQIPMLFMGEEWATSRPFPFFCDVHGELADLVRQGRRDEFKSFPAFQDPSQRDKIPDPVSEATFRKGKLDWEQAGYGVHANWLEWYKRIIAQRHRRIIPLIPRMGEFSGRYCLLGEGGVVACWNVADGKQLMLTANLSEHPQQHHDAPEGETLWQEGPPQRDGSLRPWSVRWSLQGGDHVL